jgi:hypothetical protein
MPRGVSASPYKTADRRRWFAAAHLINHVGVFKGAVAFPIAREVKAKAAQALLRQCPRHLGKHKAVLVIAQSMAQDGNVLSKT